MLSEKFVKGSAQPARGYKQLRHGWEVASALAAAV
jgi:hypothetical protein